VSRPQRRNHLESHRKIIGSYQLPHKSVLKVGG
jgi:hypothetical protein